MRLAIRPLLFAVALCSSPAFAAGGKEDHAQTDEKFKLIHVADLVALQKKPPVYVFDANAPDFRAKNGTVPGAKMLSSSHFDLKELPSDKGAKLVFYCSNPH